MIFISYESFWDFFSQGLLIDSVDFLLKWMEAIADKLLVGNNYLLSIVL
jgi:hypothetical protein